MDKLVILLLVGVLLFNLGSVVASEEVRYSVGDLIPNTNGENTTLFSVSANRVVFNVNWGMSTSTEDLELWESRSTGEGYWLKLIEIDYRNDSALFELLSDEEWKSIRNEVLEDCKKGLTPRPESGLSNCPKYCEDEPYNMGCECREGYRVWNNGCKGEGCEDTRNYFTCSNETRETDDIMVTLPNDRNSAYPNGTVVYMGDNETEVECGEFNEIDCGTEISCTWREDKNKCLGAGTQNRYEKQNKTKNMKVKERVLNYLNSTECPTDCKCTGSVVKCDINGTKSMTVIAGNSGKIIIMSKGINASIKVKLIEGENGTIIELANKVQKRLNYLPDEAFDKVKKKLKIINCSEENNCNMELDYAGRYQIQIERRSRIIGVFSKKMNVEIEVDAESGESKINKPWWAFIASEPEE